jgi:hypothetical protein
MTLRQFLTAIAEVSGQVSDSTLVIWLLVCFMVANRVTHILEVKQESQQLTPAVKESQRKSSRREEERTGQLVNSCVAYIPQRQGQGEPVSALTAVSYDRGGATKPVSFIVDSGTNALISNDPELLWGRRVSTQRIGTAETDGGLHAGMTGGARLLVGGTEVRVDKRVYVTKAVSHNLIGTNVLNKAGLTVVFHNGTVLLVDGSTFSMPQAKVLSTGYVDGISGLPTVDISARIEGKMDVAETRAMLAIPEEKEVVNIARNPGRTSDRSRAGSRGRIPGTVAGAFRQRVAASAVHYLSSEGVESSTRKVDPGDAGARLPQVPGYCGR